MEIPPSREVHSVLHLGAVARTLGNSFLSCTVTDRMGMRISGVALMAIGDEMARQGKASQGDNSI